MASSYGKVVMRSGNYPVESNLYDFLAKLADIPGKSGVGLNILMDGQNIFTGINKKLTGIILIPAGIKQEMMDP